MNPEVSVVMSCYNAEASVGAAIESILNQTFSNFEFIIIDDGSSDSTLDILKVYHAKDDRIRIIENVENIGLSASLNIGIRTAKAPIIARMDADDFSLPTRMEKQVNFLNKHPEIDILGTAVLNRKGQGEPFSTSLLPTEHKDVVKRVFRKPLVMHPTVMIKKEVYDQHGYYDINLRWAEDADLWLRIYDKVRWANLAEPLVVYTVKEKLTSKIISNNLRVTFINLKRRGLLFSKGHLFLREAAYYALKSITQKR